MKAFHFLRVAGLALLTASTACTPTSSPDVQDTVFIDRCVLQNKQDWPKDVVRQETKVTRTVYDRERGRERAFIAEMLRGLWRPELKTQYAASLEGALQEGVLYTFWTSTMWAQQGLGRSREEAIGYSGLATLARGMIEAKSKDAASMIEGDVQIDLIFGPASTPSRRKFSCNIFVTDTGRFVFGF